MFLQRKVERKILRIPKFTTKDTDKELAEKLNEIRIPCCQEFVRVGDFVLYAFADSSNQHLGCVKRIFAFKTKDIVVAVQCYLQTGDLPLGTKHKLRVNEVLQTQDQVEIRCDQIISVCSVAVGSASNSGFFCLRKYIPSKNAVVPLEETSKAPSHSSSARKFPDLRTPRNQSTSSSSYPVPSPATESTPKLTGDSGLLAAGRKRKPSPAKPTADVFDFGGDEPDVLVTPPAVVRRPPRAVVSLLAGRKPGISPTASRGEHDKTLQRRRTQGDSSQPSPTRRRRE
eukprot:RCo013454